MKKINNFYEVKTDKLNWAPIKLIDIQEEFNTFEILKNNQEINVRDNNFREISISKIHLDRIGFENEKLNDVYVYPIYMFLGTNLSNLASAYFGYIVFHKDELVDIQKKINSIYTEVYEAYKINEDIIRDKNISKKLNSIFNVNQLFQRLEEYNIIIEDKSTVLIG